MGTWPSADARPNSAPTARRDRKGGGYGDSRHRCLRPRFGSSPGQDLPLHPHRRWHDVVIQLAHGATTSQHSQLLFGFPVRPSHILDDAEQTVRTQRLVPNTHRSLAKNTGPKDARGRRRRTGDDERRRSSHDARNARNRVGNARSSVRPSSLRGRLVESRDIDHTRARNHVHGAASSWSISHPLAQSRLSAIPSRRGTGGTLNGVVPTERSTAADLAPSSLREVATGVVASSGEDRGTILVLLDSS